jgi:putative redox protein
MEMEITLPGGARVDAHFDSFVVRTDQPPSAGGEGSAPTPFDLFLASIGTCAGIFVANFCHQRAIPTDGIRILQQMLADPQTHMIREIRLDIRLPPGFPPKYADAVVRTAELCTVKKHLATPPTIVVEAHLAREP